MLLLLFVCFILLLLQYSRNILDKHSAVELYLWSTSPFSHETEPCSFSQAGLKLIPQPRLRLDSPCSLGLACILQSRLGLLSGWDYRLTPPSPASLLHQINETTLHALREPQILSLRVGKT